MSHRAELHERILVLEHDCQEASAATELAIRQSKRSQGDPADLPLVNTLGLLRSVACALAVAKSLSAVPESGKRKCALCLGTGKDVNPTLQCAACGGRGTT